MGDFGEWARKIYGKETNDDALQPRGVAVSAEESSYTPESAADIAAPPMPEPRPDKAAIKLSPLPFVKEGEESARWYAGRYVETGNPAYAVGGVLASLWTPETADDTLATLMTAAGYGRWDARPYWRYFGPETSPEGNWITRGPGWKPPYGEDFAKARDALQIPKEIDNVVEVKPSMWEPIRGARISKDFDGYGSGGGQEYYRGWNWPPN